MTTVKAKEEQKTIIQKEIENFWEEGDNYMLLIITDSCGTRRLCYNYETTQQIINALVAAQMAEMEMFKEN